MAEPDSPPDSRAAIRSRLTRDLQISRSMILKLRQVHKFYGLTEPEAPVKKTLGLIDLGHYMKEELPQLSEDTVQNMTMYGATVNGPDFTAVNMFDEALGLGLENKEKVQEYRKTAAILYEVFLAFGWESVLYIPDEITDNWTANECTADVMAAALSELPDYWPELYALIVEHSAVLWAGQVPKAVAAQDRDCYRHGVERLVALLRMQSVHAYRPGGEKGGPLAQGMTSSTHAGSTGVPHTNNDSDAASSLH